MLNCSAQFSNLQLVLLASTLPSQHIQSLPDHTDESALPLGSLMAKGYLEGLNSGRLVPSRVAVLTVTALSHLMHLHQHPRHGALQPQEP